MLRLTDYTIIQKEKVRQYFEAWSSYDITLVRQIFDEHAVYTIKNKAYKFEGVEGIIRYWRRNKARQRELDLNWNYAYVKHNNIGVIFRAKFFDIEEERYNYINGNIAFIFNEEDSIINLSEYYTKTTRRPKELALKTV